MGEVSLLHYHHGVPYVPIPEVHPHEGPRCRLATIPLTWEVPQPRLHQKLHPVSPGIVAPTFIFSILYWKYVRHAMLGLSVHLQWPLLQVLPALRASKPLPLSLRVAPFRPRHPPSIEFVCPYPDCPTWMAYHPHCFEEICIQPHPFKYSRQNVKCGLDPSRAGGGYHPVVCVENNACIFSRVYSSSASRRLSSRALISRLAVCAASLLLLLHLS